VDFQKSLTPQVGTDNGSPLWESLLNSYNWRRTYRHQWFFRWL